VEKVKRVEKRGWNRRSKRKRKSGTKNENMESKKDPRGVNYTF
jgi:hypothetical protein